MTAPTTTDPTTTKPKCDPPSKQPGRYRILVRRILMPRILMRRILMYRIRSVLLMVGLASLASGCIPLPEIHIVAEGTECQNQFILDRFNGGWLFRNYPSYFNWLAADRIAVRNDRYRLGPRKLVQLSVDMLMSEDLKSERLPISCVVTYQELFPSELSPKERALVEKLRVEIVVKDQETVCMTEQSVNLVENRTEFFGEFCTRWQDIEDYIKFGGSPYNLLRYVFLSPEQKPCEVDFVTDLISNEEKSKRRYPVTPDEYADYRGIELVAEAPYSRKARRAISMVALAVSVLEEVEGMAQVTAPAACTLSYWFLEGDLRHVELEIKDPNTVCVTDLYGEVEAPICVNRQDVIDFRIRIGREHYAQKILLKTPGESQ